MWHAVTQFKANEQFKKKEISSRFFFYIIFVHSKQTKSVVYSSVYEGRRLFLGCVYIQSKCFSINGIVYLSPSFFRYFTYSTSHRLTHSHYVDFWTCVIEQNEATKKEIKREREESEK